MKQADTQAEVQAIFSILNSLDSIKVELLNKLTLKHFGYEPMCVAFQIIMKLVRESSVLPTMETFLINPNITENIIMLLQAPTNIAVTNTDDAKHLFHTLDYYRKARKLFEFNIVSTNEMKGDTPPDLDEIIKNMEEALLEIRSNANDAKMYHMGKGSSGLDFVDKLLDNAQMEVIPSTFMNFDKVTGGFGKTDLVFLASHNKGGKSTIALNILVNQYLRHNLDICFVSLEMSEQELRENVSSIISGVEHSHIRKKECTPAEKQVIRQAWKNFDEHGRINKCRFSIWCPVTVTAMELRLKLKPYGFQAICVDYINLMDIPERNIPLHEKLNMLGRELKQTSKDLNALLLVPAQMNPDGDVRYSKSIREHANLVLAWYFGEEERATHQITVKTLAARSHANFSFRLEEDFAHKTIIDSSQQFDEVGEPGLNNSPDSMSGLN